MQDKHLPNTESEMASDNGTLLKTFLDSGVPEGSTDYTTLVIIHGWGFHAGEFRRTASILVSKHTDHRIVHRKLQEALAARTREQRPHRPPQQARLSRLHALRPRRRRAPRRTRKRAPRRPRSRRGNASRDEGARTRGVRLPRRPRQDGARPACHAGQGRGRDRPRGVVARRDVDIRATRTCRGVPSGGRPPGRVRQTAGALWCVAGMRVTSHGVRTCRGMDRLRASGATPR